MSETIPIIKPEEKKRSSLSIIWFIPLLALIIGGWMIYQQWQNQGVIVTVSFEGAEGLEAGKTKVKSRNVDIGLLTTVGFNEDRTRIIATIEIDKEMNDFLRKDSQFWIVKPRIGANGISGINTIFSGAYIEVFPGTFTASSDTFVGLENPPVTALDAEGLYLTLASKEGTGLSVGDPVIYRGFRVGSIQTYKFDARDKLAKYSIFIDAPYDALVTTNSHFWNAGGIEFESSAKGFKVNIASVETLISGGIQFDVPENISLGEPVKKSRQFRLYSSEKDIIENRDYLSFEYAVLVDDSVRGLFKGAPVEYRGVRVGSVVSPYITPREVKRLKVSDDGSDNQIPVLIKIEPQRLLGQSSEAEIIAFNKEFKQNILKGLTANLESANILTGSLLINLGFNGIKVEAIEKFGPYSLIPSTREGLAKIQDSFEQMLDSFNKLPFDQLSKQTTQTLASANSTLITANKALQSMQVSVQQLNRLLKDKDTQKLSKNINASLKELQKTLRGLQPNSGAYREVEKTMFKLQKTLDSMQPMLRKISNNPSTLIFGTPRGDDLQPRRKP